MGCGTNIVPGFQEANRKVNIPKDELVYNKLMDESVYEPTANTPQDIIEAQRTVRHIQETGKHPDDGAAWRKLREDGAKERKTKMAQPDSLVFAASQVKEGKMSVKKFRELVQKSDSPVTPMQEVPELVSVTNLARALDTGKSGKGRIVGLPGIEIQQGTRVGLRLDIPAYQDRNTWVNAIHFNEKVEGSRPGNAYSTASAGTNVIFGQHSKKAIKVATGIAKSPFAVMDVEWQNQTPEQTHKEITAALEDSKQPESRWTQIGMNPNRSGFFYDKATFLPVSSASRVLQVGALVMAQDVQYVGREGATMFSPYQSESRAINRVKIHRKKPTLTAKEQENINKIPDTKSPDSFYYPNRRVSEGSLTKEDIDGLFSETLATSMTDEGIQFVVEKGVPSVVSYLENQKDEFGNRYAGSWDVTRDMISADLHIHTVNGSAPATQFTRTILHEYGHMAMNRLWRMYLVDHKSLRTLAGSSTLYHDITKYDRRIKDAFDKDISLLEYKYTKLAVESLKAVNPNIDFAKRKPLSSPLNMELIYKDYIKDVHTDLHRLHSGEDVYDARLEGYYDIIDAMSGGVARDDYNVFGHGREAFGFKKNSREEGDLRLMETAANLFEAKFNKDQHAWNKIKKEMPNLASAFESMIDDFKGQTDFLQGVDFDVALQESTPIVKNTKEKAYVR